MAAQALLVQQEVPEPQQLELSVLVHLELVVPEAMEPTLTVPVAEAVAQQETTSRPVILEVTASIPRMVAVEVALVQAATVQQQLI
jgi:hypothetical protein